MKTYIEIGQDAMLQAAIRMHQEDPTFITKTMIDGMIERASCLSKAERSNILVITNDRNRN